MLDERSKQWGSEVDEEGERGWRVCRVWVRIDSMSGRVVGVVEDIV